MKVEIQRSELVEQIMNALRDEFVAEITREEDAIALRFVSGQKFTVTVEEEK